MNLSQSNRRCTVDTPYSTKRFNSFQIYFIMIVSTFTSSYAVVSRMVFFQSTGIRICRQVHIHGNGQISVGRHYRKRNRNKSLLQAQGTRYDGSSQYDIDYRPRNPESYLSDESYLDDCVTRVR